MPTILTYVPVSDGQPSRTALEVLTHSRQLAAENGWICAAVALAPDKQYFKDQLVRFEQALVVKQSG